MIQSLADLNNNGARCIMHKNYDEAISCFFRAMKLTKQHLRELEMTDAWKQVSNEEHWKSKSSLQHEFLEVDTREAFTAEGSYVFKKVVVMTCTESNDVAAVMSSLCSVAVLSLYNLALAHHLSGLHEQCRERLERARNYYELSYKLQEQQNGSNYSLLHSLSVLNNIGAIYDVLNEKETSEKFFGRLLSALTYLRENGELEPLQNSWGGFWSNASTSILCKPTAAAAA